MTRKRLTARERDAIWAKQDGKCAICGEPMLPGQRIDGEHTVPVALGGPAKPDRLVHAEPCHRAKTSGTRATSHGSDVHAIAKLNRLTGETKSQWHGSTKSQAIKSWQSRKLETRNSFKKQPRPSVWPKAVERQT